MKLVWPANDASCVPLAASQTLTELSSAPETIRMPSGEPATALTPPMWPLRVRSSLPLAASQTLTVPSAEPETIRLPGARKPTALTELVWPVRVRSSLPVAGGGERRPAGGGAPALAGLAAGRGDDGGAAGGVGDAARHDGDCQKLPA